jgi:hypothetical protein
MVVFDLTMPWLIRALGLHGSDQTKAEEQEARHVLLREAIAYLSRRRSKRREHTNLYSEVIGMYQRRLDALPVEEEAEQQNIVDRSERKDALLSVLQVEREAPIRLRDEGQINDEVLRTLQRELDLSEGRIHTAAVLD